MESAERAVPETRFLAICKARFFADCKVNQSTSPGQTGFEAEGGLYFIDLKYFLEIAAAAATVGQRFAFIGPEAQPGYDQWR